MPLLLAVSKHLEQQAAGLGPSATVLSAFQTAERFTGLTHRRYTELARHAAFVGALGAGMARTPAPGVRGAILPPDDPLLDEWSVAILGPHFAGALVARDLGDTGAQEDRRFDFALTYEREVVIQACISLMQRIAPEQNPTQRPPR